MDSETWIYLFEIKKDRLPDFLLQNYVIYQFVNNFLTLFTRFTRITRKTQREELKR